MKAMRVPEGLRYAGVAVLFAICGTCSPIYDARSFGEGPPPLMLPVPFALLCALLFLRQWRAIIAVPLMVAVWVAAYTFGYFLGWASPVLLGPGCGGFIGGGGLVLCAAICHRRLLSRENVFRGAVIGSVSGLAFAPWAGVHYMQLNFEPPKGPALLLAFAIWQAAVGTYLYAVVHRPQKETLPGDAVGLTILRLT